MSRAVDFNLIDNVPTENFGIVSGIKKGLIGAGAGALLAGPPGMVDEGRTSTER